MKKKSESEQKKGKAPTHAAYYVKQYKGGGEDRSFWTRIGSAWLHEDGEGVNVQLDTVPVDGRLTIRIIKEQDQPQAESQQA